jgi:hypothetical protein
LFLSVWTSSFFHFFHLRRYLRALECHAGVVVLEWEGGDGKDKGGGGEGEGREESVEICC